MKLNNEFTVFDERIRPDDPELKLCQDAHADLRSRLKADEDISKVHVADFLQGSYARNTMLISDEKNDVDIILVTSLHERQYPPDAALAYFVPFLEKNYPNQFSMNGRSLNIQLDEVELDLVPTSAPSEARIAQLSALDMILNERMIAKASDPNDVLDPEEIVGDSGDAILTGNWSRDPLRIPDRHVQEWQNTHPLATQAWTTEKNGECNKIFLRVARAVKWWRKHVSEGPKHPKSYPIEHMAGDHCPSGISSVAEGLTRTLESMYVKFGEDAERGVVPWLDPRGLPPQNNNVLSLITIEDFKGFVGVLGTAASNARRAFEEEDAHESGKLWRLVLGEKFPLPPRKVSNSGPRGGFSPRPEREPEPVGGRFAGDRFA